MFTICNFTKPFSLFKQGMQLQMLSKRAQAVYVASLEKKIADLKEGESLEADAKLLKEEGIVRE
jgi:hypothetical protein